MELGAVGEGLAVYTVSEVFFVSAAVAEIDKALIDISAAGRHEHSTRILGILSDDIDHSVDCVCSPDRAARPADDLDSLDILKHCVLNLPINSCVEWCVNGSAVDKHEYVSRKGTPEPAYADRPCIRVDARDFNTGRQTDGLRDTCGPGTPDVFLGDDVDRCRSSADSYGLFGRRCNLDLAKLF